MNRRTWLLMAALMLASPVRAIAQGSNFLLPIDEIERILREGEFEVLRMTPSRGLEGERTYQATVMSEGNALQMKYAPAGKGADAFNNQPRYELAAYAIQKLFLDPENYVVPPTVVRAFPQNAVQTSLDLVGSKMTPPADATFRRWPMTLVALQYWMFQVEAPEDLHDKDLIESNELYERHLGNLNLLTYLIRHNDSNRGNFLRSMDTSDPRVYSVDNGVAFSRQESDRGFYWRDLQLDRYPRESIERLRAYSEEDLQARLGVIAQYEIRDGNFVEVPPTENLDSGDGVRTDEVRVQLGLKESEIHNVYRRLARLIEWIDEGKYEVFP